MKKINSILAGLLLTATVLLTQQATAQAPQKMSYQSVIRNSSNVLLAGTQVGIKISVLQGSATGTPVYVETQTATTNGNGLVSIQIGMGTATTGTFAGINWAAGLYFIKTETDPAGGSNYTIAGTQEILSVPYALYAKKAENGITPAQADAIVAHESTIAVMQTQIAALQRTSPKSVIIGTQTWQNTNLDVSTYRDGTPIPQVTNPTAWAGLNTGAWCYNYNDATNGITYGKLYNWYAVVGIHDNDPITPNKVLAPFGWHVPSNAEWATLTTFLGGQSIAGGAMKSTTLWESPNEGATNSSGFSGLPGGFRAPDGSFSIFGYSGSWYSSSEVSITNAYALDIYNSDGMTLSYFDNKKNGFSVRCLRD